ncbi:MAG: glycosyltransferase [Deltaproteobacteria bacterium]|nr:glycosyltransferase [Deltaproteobacteria bacterium]
MGAPRIAVLAAAGRGRRIHPRSENVPKVLLPVAGKPLLVRNLELLRDALGIRRFLCVVGHLGEQVRAALGDGQQFGVELRYVESLDVDGGLGTVFATVEPHIAEPFVLILGDELYLGSNHAALAAVAEPYVAVCALSPSDDPELIGKNYSVHLDGDRITAAVEKPAQPLSPYIGCGTFVFAPEIFADARAVAAEGRPRFEITDAIDHAARRGAAVRAFVLTGDYLNVNSVEDLSTANFLARSAELPSSRVSLIVPAYNEAASIARVVREFLPHVDELLVMDNCSADGTGELARAAGATVLSRPLRGYGDALRQGMDAAQGDILVLVEADGTFSARDLGKLLEYLKDADMVIGTRTTRQMIHQGANMDGLLRWGNVVVSKLIEALWWDCEPRLTDVGCTYRAIWQDAYRRVRPYLTQDDATFSPELMIEVLRSQLRLIEVPVHYFRRRGGESKHSASRWHSMKTGMRMIALILRKRLNFS